MKSILIATVITLFFTMNPVFAGDSGQETGNYEDFRPEANDAANDAIAVIVNPMNRLKTLTIAQLRAIFTHKARSWNVVGAAIDLTIRPIITDNASPVHEVFRERVLGGGEFQKCEVMSMDDEVLREVARDEAAIGLVTLSSARNHRGVRIIGVNGKRASLDNPGYQLLIHTAT